MMLKIHVRSHWRIFAALGFGIVVWLLTSPMTHPFRIVLASDAFFVLYLASIAVSVGHKTPASMRKVAKQQDEGVAAIFLIVLAVIASSVTSIFLILNGGGEPAALNIVLAIVSVVLGWFTFHIIMTSHYAHRFYNGGRDMAGIWQDAGGLDIPGAKEPDFADFLYHSLVIGMTAQVADIDTTTSKMRRLVLAHSVVAFFYNTLIIALAINVVAGQAH
ncbi:Uncharacterized membrane protein [Arboricoccus pini]|uniref:Uncharacterized membrane protein n=1 Tax=Arboricoccus pini TaxID=1963835 RepID=A0A212QU81_9PROT|nr:DUF1345 domain-containing protein [Arboricoccus pini]SNB63169.1 Uncharacterized membrane protein [Arboricoccus pini]